ncbi:MAG: chemotaxis protein CheD [Gemmatimonadaceae bacterium]|nr:chemotaxis protein CheD [Gemmatimonadaceae bacterium]MCW5824938.1 chemotaxis protein CheD [Gemmatimonadaceae bacterium]
MSTQHVRIANLAVARGSGRLVAVGLGSCVVVTLYDRQRMVGGMAHILLPDPSAARDASNAARFATTAVPMLIDALKRAGAPGPYEAKLAGGAALFGTLLGSGGQQVGERNVAAARRAVAAAGIGIVAAETGGASGRTASFDVATGALEVRSVRGGIRVL